MAEPRVKVLTEAQKLAYLQNSGSCPVCACPDIEGGPVEIDGPGAYQEISCNKCGAAWHDILKLVDVELVSSPIHTMYTRTKKKRT